MKHMRSEFLSQQCTQSKSRVQLHSGGCPKHKEKNGVWKTDKCGWQVLVCSDPVWNWWSSCPKAWELSHANLPYHHLMAAWVPDFCRVGRHLRMSECLCVDTPSIKTVQPTQFGIVGKKGIKKYRRKSVLTFMLHFIPICLNVAMKRNSFNKYCIGKGTAWHRKNTLNVNITNPPRSPNPYWWAKVTVLTRANWGSRMNLPEVYTSFLYHMKSWEK